MAVIIHSPGSLIKYCYMITRTIHDHIQLASLHTLLVSASSSGRSAVSEHVLVTDYVVSKAILAPLLTCQEAWMGLQGLQENPFFG